jgi:hypothetical protein
MNQMLVARNGNGFYLVARVWRNNGGLHMKNFDVYEFENFMDQFLKEHPEVVREQHRGWSSFWDVKINPETTHIHKEDLLPDDLYGFRWHTHKSH